MAKKIGVIYDPEISEKDLSLYHRAIVIASDGVWNKVSNEDVCDII